MIMIDIDMPDNCDECRFNTEYGFCKAMPDNFCGNTDNMKRPEWCPLKEQESWINEIAEYQQSISGSGMHELDDYEKGKWDGLQIAWNIISEGR